MCYFQWLAQSGKCPDARKFLNSYFQILVLLSFVLGALTGVGMWFTSIQISAETIGRMVDEFHWLWATEWTFFCLEIISGYAFFRYGANLNDKARMSLLALYAFAAWMSLFWINGIISWQLTPGQWISTRNVWDGFLNPTFWPSLFYRTVASLAIASLVACVVINTIAEFSIEQKKKLINQAAWLMAPMILMPILGAWYLYVIPEDSREWVLGGSTIMTMFMQIMVGSSVLIAAYAFLGLIGKKLYINIATALLLCALAFGATAGGEFVREGIRKPFTIRGLLYSNSITKDDVVALRKSGIVQGNPYPVHSREKFPTEQLQIGSEVYRLHCSICHTLSGVNGMTHLSGSWTTQQKRMNIAKLQHTKPFMPPFAGTSAELESLVQFLSWQDKGRPLSWTDSTKSSEWSSIIKQIEGWLEEATPYYMLSIKQMDNKGPGGIEP